jgi:CubicO group peptidase (beta-lactamase class C family)
MERMSPRPAAELGQRMIPGDLVTSTMEQLGVPGVAVGIIHGDREEVEGFGVTSLKHPLEVDPDTCFQIGSITKTFTATAVMRLVEQGKLDLDLPVRTYVPELRLADEAVARSVTLRHLLNHTGGWVGDYFPALGRGDDVLMKVVGRLDRLEQLTPLGTVFSYNNAGFYVAGRAIESVTEMPFEIALQELVLVPLGLENAYVFPEDVMTDRFVVGHDRSGQVARPWALPRITSPVGGLITSVRDLLRYARMQWAPGEFLTPKSLAELRRPQAPVGRPPGFGFPVFGESVGLGWFLVHLGGRPFITHPGGTNCQLTRILVGPEDRFAVVVLTNHDDGLGLAQEVERHVLESLLKISPLEPPQLDASVSELSEFVGEYEATLQTARISLSGTALKLQLENRGGFPEVGIPPAPNPAEASLRFEGPDSVIAGERPGQIERGDFIRDEEGNIRWYRSEGRLFRRVSKPAPCTHSDLRGEDP